jgi:hypothetical protein
LGRRQGRRPQVSQPERYEPRARRIGGPWKMVKCKDGPYVCHEQHAEIVAALAADKQAADRATFDAIRAFTVLKDENAALQAEVDRLRKAGELMDRVAEDFKSIERSESGGSEIMFAVREWLAAKGVQP